MADDNVVRLDGMQPNIEAPVKPNNEVIRLLEEWLRRARTGELQAIGLVGVDASRYYMTAAISEGYRGNVLAALEICKARVIEAYFKDEQ